MFHIERYYAFLFCCVWGEWEVWAAGRAGGPGECEGRLPRGPGMGEGGAARRAAWKPRGLTTENAHDPFVVPDYYKWERVVPPKLGIRIVNALVNKCVHVEAETDPSQSTTRNDWASKRFPQVATSEGMISSWDESFMQDLANLMHQKNTKPK